jgi:Uma2 family endonuclease
MGAYEISIANLLQERVAPHARTHKLGRPFCEMLFDLAPLIRQRRPDFAFVSYQRWAANVPVPRTNAWKVIPDLAVEVVSPYDLMLDVLQKVREYFEVGVRLVWLILPTERMVYVYRSPTNISVVSLNESLDGADVLPGFQMPLKDLFEDAPPP